MKIRQTPDQLIIDNSLFMPIAAGIMLGLGGVAVGTLGSLNHLWWLTLAGLALLVIGTLVAVFSKSMHIVLTRSGDCSIATKSLSGHIKSHAFALKDITAVELQSSQTQHLTKDADGSQRYDTEVKSTVYLKTTDARMFQLGSKTRTLNIGGMLGVLIQAMPLKAEAEQIAAFIGVPLQVAEATSLAGASKTHIG